MAFCVEIPVSSPHQSANQLFGWRGQGNRFFTFYLHSLWQALGEITYRNLSTKAPPCLRCVALGSTAMRMESTDFCAVCLAVGGNGGQKGTEWQGGGRWKVRSSVPGCPPSSQALSFPQSGTLPRRCPTGVAPSAQDIEWHFIGHLQSNKAKQLVEGCKGLATVETVDSDKLAAKLSAAVQALGRGPVRVYIQVAPPPPATGHPPVPVHRDGNANAKGGRGGLPRILETPVFSRVFRNQVYATKDETQREAAALT